jgi:hypothetical protein
MIEAWHRADERDVCESMAIADTSVSAGLKEAGRRSARRGQLDSGVARDRVRGNLARWLCRLCVVGGGAG